MNFLNAVLFLILMPLVLGTFPTASQAAEASSSAIVGVESLMKSPDKHPGVIQVEGAVSSVSPKKGTITLIDTSELAECGVANCAEYVLPVQWKGPFPVVKEIVRIKGKVEKVNGKRIFVATSLKKINSKAKVKDKDED